MDSKSTQPNKTEILKKNLYEAGHIGLDMSPGDPLCLEALQYITLLEFELDESKD